MKVYTNPFYYEIAFSFVDVKKQVELFEKIIEKYSKIKVKRVLDIACGPSLQLRELAKRGYEAVGLDLSKEMLDYLKQKAKEEGIKIETVRADMRNFKLKKKVDFAFILMGSFRFKSNEELLNHLNCVANSLKKGGLYLIENMELDWLNFKPQSWVMEKDGIKIKATYKLEPKDAISQSKKFKLAEKRIVKHVYPQEFLTLLKLNKKFEFLGWFERFKLKKLRKGSMDNIALLRRR